MSHTKVFAAFRAGGVPEREASEATDALMGLKDSDIATIRDDVRDASKTLTKVESDVRLLKWQVGGLYGFAVAIVGLLLRLMWKQGAL